MGLASSGAASDKSLALSVQQSWGEGDAVLEVLQVPNQ